MKNKTLGLTLMLTGGAITLAGCFASFLPAMVGGSLIMIAGALYMIASGFDV